MKRVRYVTIGFVFLLLTGTLCACGGTTKERKDWERISMVSIADTCTNRGYIFCDNRMIFHFFDPESGVEAPLCTKVNCTHSSDDCDAAFGAAVIVAPIEDSLYYITRNVKRESQIWKADMSETNRKLLYTIPNAETCSYVCFENGYLFYAYYNTWSETGEPLDKWDAGFALMDLETKELKQVKLPEKGYQTQVVQATISEGNLYYFYSYNKLNLSDYSYEELSKNKEYFNEYVMCELWKYDPVSGENVCLKSWNGQQQMQSLVLGYGYLYIAIDGEGYLEQLGSGTVSRTDLRIGEGEASGVILADEGVYIMVGKRVDLWRYNEKEPETIRTFEGDLTVIIRGITKDWIYVAMFDKNAQTKYQGDFCMSKESFLRGDPEEWKPVPKGT